MSLEAGRWTIRFTPHSELYARANDPLLLLRELGTLGEISVRAIIDEVPALADFEPFGVYCSWEITLKSETATEAAIAEVFEFVEGNCDLEIVEGVAPVAEAVLDAEIEAMPSFADLLDEPAAEVEAEVPSFAELAESMSMAMMLVLESLAPTERAVFVLREVFEVGYEEIAEAVGKSPDAVRQIAHRARKHVGARRPRTRASLSEAQAALESFRQAIETGNPQGLLDVLAPGTPRPRPKTGDPVAPHPAHIPYYQNALARQQQVYARLIADGTGIRWPDIDEDISVRGMLDGVPARRGRG